MYSCYACNFYFLHHCKKPLLFVFSKHSKNVYQPSWRDSAAEYQPVSLSSNSLSCDWECKGKKNFLIGKRKVKNFIFSSVRFSIRFRLLSKRGAKVRRFFRLSQELSKFNFRRLLLSGHGWQYKYRCREVPNRFNFSAERLLWQIPTPCWRLGMQK
jgi:hypothetical protein